MLSLARASSLSRPTATALVVEAARCPSNCSGNGICDDVSSACHCFAGFSGTACAAEVAAANSCPNACSGRGFCVRSRCTCDEFWRGDACDEPAACPMDCSGYGQCVRGRCVCDDAHTGADCARAKDTCPGWPAVCNGPTHGTCNADTGECICRAAYVGSACETLAASVVCRTNCTGHGVCDVQLGGCVCSDGWEGSACQRRAGAMPLWLLLLLAMTALLCATGSTVGAVLAYCYVRRGITPRDALRGHWHVRKEEGWFAAEVEGQIPGARFERFFEDVEQERKQDQERTQEKQQGKKERRKQRPPRT